MKRTVFLFLVFILAFTALTAYAGQISISAPDVKNTELPPITTSWVKSNGYYILTAAWQEDGDDWEVCVTGLPEKLTAAQTRLLVSAVRQEKTAVISGNGLIDVEKATNKLPLTYGEKLFTDDINKDGDWGDSQHCWAASVSDMLELTGWIRYAAETDTGRTFTDEDDLFGFFNRAFVNDGAYHGSMLNWIFTGADDWDMASPRTGITGPMIRKYASQRTLLDLRADRCDSTEEYMALLCERLPLLKKGGALGTVISLCGIEYPLKSDPDEYVSYDSVLGAFVRYDICYVDWSEVTEMTFVPDARTGMPIPVAMGTDGKCYETSSGAAVDKNDVWIGGLVYDDEQDLWFSIDQTCYYDEDEDPFYMRGILYSADETDLTKPEYQPILTGGEHAVTIMGYAMNLSETDPARKIRAIILADSDNDAAIFRPDESTVRREDRPNTYTLYLAETVPVNTSEAVSLNGYLPYMQTLLYSVTALMPAPDVKPEIPPQTGDSFPGAIYAVTMLASVTAVIRIVGRKKGVGERTAGAARRA